MYSSISNHLFNFCHYIVGFTLLCIIYPRLIFKDMKECILEEIVSNYIRMVLVTIVCGYLLSILKLFEFIGLVIVFLLIYLVKNLSKLRGGAFSEALSKYNSYVYDLLDRQRCLKQDSISFLVRSKNQVVENLVDSFSSKNTLFNMFLIIAVFIYTAYLRLYDTYKHAAPAMSDAYVTLAWMKYIIRRDLFHDGIYPQGFHIYMATIQKFAYIDPIYVLKYTGPLNGVLITFGIYFVISRVSGSSAYGIIGGIVYGILGSYLSSEWMRQASTNSQEFGFVFVLPTLYFIWKFIIDSRKGYFWTAFCGLCVTGLVHTIAFAFLGMGLGIIVSAALLVNVKVYWKDCIKLCSAGILSVVISAIPAGIGLLMGKQFHGSSVEFLSAKMKVGYPEVKSMDYIALLAICIIFIYILITIRNIRSKFAEMCILLLGSSAFVLHYFGGVVTQNTVVATRFSDFWTLFSPINIGIAMFILGKPFLEPKGKRFIESIVVLSLLLCCIFYIKPEPIIPYKMERDDSIEQYLRISSTFRPTQWMIVSQDEGYAVVLGSGYHLMMKDFFDMFNPSDKKFIRRDTKEEVKTPDIFIYQEKKMFTTDFSNLKANYERRKVEYAKLDEWISKYKVNHNNLSIFYEDDYLRIYHIHQSIDRKEMFDAIWNEDN